MIKTISEKLTKYKTIIMLTVSVLLMAVLAIAGTVTKSGSTIAIDGVDVPLVDGSVPFSENVNIKTSINTIYYVQKDNSTDLRTKMANDNSIVIVPYGNYVVETEPLTVGENTSVYGAQTRLYLNGDDISIINIVDKNDILISGFVFDGNDQSVGEAGIRIEALSSNISNIQIGNSKIKDTKSHAILITASNDNNMVSNVQIDNIICENIASEKGCVILYNTYYANVNNINIDGNGVTKYPFQLAKGCNVNFNNIVATNMNATNSRAQIGRETETLEACNVNINNYIVNGINTALSIEENSRNVNLNNFNFNSMNQYGINVLEKIHASNGYINNTVSHGAYLKDHNGSIFQSIEFNNIGAYAIREDNVAVNKTIVTGCQFLNITQATAVYNKNGVNVGSVVCNNIGIYDTRNCD